MKIFKSYVVYFYIKICIYTNLKYLYLISFISFINKKNYVYCNSFN